MVDQVRCEAVRLVSVVEAAASTAARAVADADVFTPGEADLLIRALDRAERKLAGAKVVLARKVADSTVWQTDGHTSPADYYAAVTGTSIGAAKGALATSAALPGLPGTRAALLDGSVSVAQGQLVADAAKANPDAERELLGRAGRSSHKELRDAALRAKAAADRDLEATHQRIHTGRHCATGVDAEGAWTLTARGTPVDGSVVNAELDVLSDQIFRSRRSADALEGRSHYRFDALVEMARNSRAHRLGANSTGKAKQAPPTHLAVLRLDISALQRGWTIGEELCEIVGIGPIPVAQARAVLGDAALKLVLTKGVDVANVTSLTRGPTQAMRYSMLWTNPYCVIDGCGNTILQYDHRTGTEYADTHHTRLDELDRICAHHHTLHTRRGWALVAGAGPRAMVPPDDPRHPHYRPPSSGDPPEVDTTAPGELTELAALWRDAYEASGRNLTGRDPTLATSPP